MSLSEPPRSLARGIIARRVLGARTRRSAQRDPHRTRARDNGGSSEERTPSRPPSPPGDICPCGALVKHGVRRCRKCVPGLGGAPQGPADAAAPPPPARTRPGGGGRRGLAVIVSVPLVAISACGVFSPSATWDCGSGRPSCACCSGSCSPRPPQRRYPTPITAVVQWLDGSRPDARPKE